MKKFRLVYLLFLLSFIYLAVSSHSGGEATSGGAGKTKAPGETYCSDCHGGGAYAPVTVSIQIFTHGTTTAVTSYQGGTLYDMSVTVIKSAGTPAGYGFQMTCLKSGTNAALAGYSAFPASIHTKLLAASGRTYIEQNGASASNIFSFSWTAPASGSGTVVFYAAGNAVNGNGSSSGDNPNFTSLTIPEAAAALSVTGVKTNVLCNGAGTGAINITATGGTPAYTYNWGSGVTTEDRTGLSAGTYTVTVTDAASATASASFTITEPANPVTVPGVVTYVLCNGAATGAINITATGGTGAYTYNWGSGITTEDRTGLVAGNYAVTVTDANSCTGSASFTITQPAAIIVSGTTTNVLCNGAGTGAINASATGGTSTYTYNWGSGVTSQNRTGLSAGNYTVTVTDGNNCTASHLFTITQPAALTVPGIVTNVACFGGNNGAINITATGGTSAYTYNWGSGVTNEDRTALIAGSYPVTVTDANSCQATASFTVGQPTAALSLPGVVTNVSCFGGNNGAINTTPTGGTGPYFSFWNDAVSSEDRTTLAAGNYAVTVTDNNGCTASTSFTVTQPATALTVSGTTTNVLCFGGNNGAINITAAGGTGAYTYNWGGGITSEDRTSLTSGNYSVIVSDANSCTASVSFTITQPLAALAVTGTTSNVLCFGGNNGAINITATGGTATYNYSWGVGILTEDRNTLIAGNYAVTVTDANSCTASSSFTISQPTTAVAVSGITTDISCFGGNDGAINITASGGTGTYGYNWGGGITSEDRTALNSGSYSVTVNDANSCTASASFTIAEPTQLSVTHTQGTISCFGGTTTINVSGSGGTSPYTGGGSFVVQAGTHAYTITDANGCTASASVIITQPTQLTASATTVTIPCNGGSGTITVIASGGTGPYTGTGNFSVTTPGSYTYPVSDANGCTTSATGTAQSASGLTATSTITPVRCNGSCDGSISVSISGGTSPYSFIWSNSLPTQNINNLCAGNYVQTITDNAGCSLVNNYTVPDATPVQIAVTKDSAFCFGDSANIFASGQGGTAPYIYLWNSGQSQGHIKVLAGNYTLTLSDNNGCTATADVLIAQPSQLTVTEVITNVLCFGNNTGAIDITVGGGTGANTYNWNAGISSEDRTAIASGNYAVTVTDANSCNASASFTITQPANALTVTGVITNVSCFGDNNGAIDITATGGTTSYTYNWGLVTTEDRTSLSPGNYQLTVTDNNSCTTSASFTISQPSAALTVQGTAIDVQCFGGSNGAITITPTGGTPSYTYNWGGGVISQDRFGLAAGNYTVTITDANSCNAAALFTITQPATALNVTGAINNVSCYGNNNGTITLSVTGGTAAYTFDWGAGVTTENRNNLTGGNYSVTVTDANGCTTSSQFIVTQPDSINITLVSIIDDAGSGTGAVDISVSGGTNPYSYLWNNTVTIQDISNLTDGVYSVVVTDSNGCSNTLGNIVLLSTSISNSYLSQVQIYPNPASDNIFIRLPAQNKQQAQLSIISIQGTLIKTIPINETDSWLNISDLPAALYLFEISTRNESARFRILKVD